MTSKSFMYYGFDRETYKECADLIRFTNRKHVIIMNAWFLIVNLLYVLFSAFNLFGVTQERIPFYACYSVLSIGFALVLGLLPQFSERHSTFMAYICTVLLLSYGILTSIAQPYMPAIMYIIMFLLISLLFISNMLHTTLIAVLSTVVFLLTSRTFKTFSIYYLDIYNALIVAVLSVGLHYMFQRTRLSQFVLYQHNQQIQRELEVKSSFDSLTGLLNRGRFFSITEEVLRHCEEDYLTLCILDLDCFKQINDKLGHQMGDKVIQTAGRTIQEALALPEEEKQTTQWDLHKPFSIAGRLGGDEFILLLRGKTSREEVRTMLQAMLDTLNAVRYNGLEGIHASFGVTEFKSGEHDVDSAYTRADAALYESKRAGKNQIRFYDATPHKEEAHA